MAADGLRWLGSLVTDAIIVNLVASGGTNNELKVRAKSSQYPTDIKVANAEFATVRPARDDIHCE